MIAHAPVERNDSAIFSSANVTDQIGMIDGVAHEGKKIGL
jgi:hypothetical protein